MQPTEKYYEHDAYRREAVGHILAAEPDSRTGGGRIALDGTVFYPEGGGQPADRGTLTLADGTVLTVTDVHEQAGVIWHMVTSLPAGAVPGAEAAQAIDWAWRFDKMQQHTGEHILSGILHSMFGAENVGFHIGSPYVRMDSASISSASGSKRLRGWSARGSIFSIGSRSDAFSARSGCGAGYSSPKSAPRPMPRPFFPSLPMFHLRCGGRSRGLHRFCRL